MVDLVNDGVDGHDHEGQVVVYHAHDDRTLGVDHGEVGDVRSEHRVDELEDAQRIEQLVENAGVLQ